MELQIQRSPPLHRPLRANTEGPRDLAAQAGKVTRAPRKASILCPPGPGALLAEGQGLKVSTALLPSRSLRTLQKQWLEVLSTGQHILTFLFMGERSSAQGTLGKEGSLRMGRGR